MVARYEARLLRRSWVFLIFAVLGVVGISCFQFLIGSVDSAMEYGLTSGRNLWYLRALPSCIPYMNAYLFNGLQALLIVFFVAEMEKRARVTTMEPLWTRPCTNGELQWGASSWPCRNGGCLEYYFHAGDFDGSLVYSKGEC